jgi:hypothetical protein
MFVSVNIFLTHFSFRQTASCLNGKTIDDVVRVLPLFSLFHVSAVGYSQGPPLAIPPGGY